MPGRDERIDSFSGKLQHQPSANEHREDLVLEAERSPAEPAAATRRGDPGAAEKIINQVLVSVFLVAPLLAGSCES